MKVLKITGVIVIWLACSVFSYGVMLGDFTHKYPDSSHVYSSVVISMFGPFAIPAVCFLGDPSHFRLKPIPKEERYQIFHKKYPNLTREDFESFE